MFVFGKSGPGSLTLASDFLHLGFPSFAQSMAWLESAPPTLDFAHPDFPIFLRCVSQPGLPFSACNKVFLELLLLVLDSSHMELLLSIQSLFCLGPSSLALDMSNLELSSLLRSFLRLESTPLVFGESSSELSLSALDRVNLGPSVLLQRGA